MSDAPLQRCVRKNFQDTFRRHGRPDTRRIQNSSYRELRLANGDGGDERSRVSRERMPARSLAPARAKENGSAGFRADMFPRARNNFSRLKIKISRGSCARARSPLETLSLRARRGTKRGMLRLLHRGLCRPDFRALRAETKVGAKKLHGIPSGATIFLLPSATSDRETSSITLVCRVSIVSMS